MLFLSATNNKLFFVRHRLDSRGKSRSTGAESESMTETTSLSVQLIYFPSPTCTGCFFVVANSPAKEYIVFKFGNRRSGLPFADVFVFIGTYEFSAKLRFGVSRRPFCALELLGMFCADVNVGNKFPNNFRWRIYFNFANSARTFAEVPRRFIVSIFPCATPRIIVSHLCCSAFWKRVESCSFAIGQREHCYWSYSHWNI